MDKRSGLLTRAKFSKDQAAWIASLEQEVSAVKPLVSFQAYHAACDAAADAFVAAVFAREPLSRDWAVRVTGQKPSVAGNVLCTSLPGVRVVAKVFAMVFRLMQPCSTYLPDVVEAVKVAGDSAVSAAVGRRYGAQARCDIEDTRNEMVCVCMCGRV
jgi:hypothetical protein